MLHMEFSGDNLIDMVSPRFTAQSNRRNSPALFRLAASCSGFLLAGVLPSIDSAGTKVPLFSSFSGNMLPSDSSGENNHRRMDTILPCRSSFVPRRFLPEVSRFPREECSHMPGSLTPPEHGTTRISRCHVLLSRHPTSSASGKGCFRSSIARLCFPLSTLPHALAGRRGMTDIIRDSDYLLDLRGLPHGKALSLLPNNFSSLFKNLSLPHGLPVIEHFLIFSIICSSSFSFKYSDQSSISSSR